ncbi:MAG: DUF4954 family protein [Phycisphaeraceae bacterium]|nr:DUF4954 family protein [Phycisphaeraceae bacterium]
MGNTTNTKALTQAQIDTLQLQGCTARDWAQVTVTDTLDTTCIKNVDFSGQVQIGNLSGTIKTPQGLTKPCGIYNAALANCTVADGCRIANVGVHIANYNIEAGACIEHVGLMQTNPGATFGNGIEISVLNEAGGREIVLFDKLSAQFAYMMCLHRYRPKMVAKLKSMAMDYTESIKSDRGTVGANASLCSVKELVDVNIGPWARISQASSLKNGSILSCETGPTTIGTDVIAEDFIVAESSSVTGGAVLAEVFVGQGCQVGKQYSAEGSVFFANCEAFHGEAVSIFAGPYTVTHHKSSLLIAGQFSFYNAGSGTNQSNHMYKLGPCHEGKLLRGTKTGSFSYMMWPCRVGPFSVVLGKHSTNFDTSDFPFSHIEARHDGKCMMVPGLHLTTVGTVRDGAKWPQRDRRTGCEKRDMIDFDVFSPYTIGKMIKARTQLKDLMDTTDRAIDTVSIGGALVKRLILRISQKYYRTGIEVYLREKLVQRIEKALADKTDLKDALAVDSSAVYSDPWVDLGGQLMPKQRLDAFEDAIENGTIDSVDAFVAATRKIHEAYAEDEWAWAQAAYEQVFSVDTASMTGDTLQEAANALVKVKSKFFNLVAADADKEFAETSQIGFGQDGELEDVTNDFREVRGEYLDNAFVKDMKQKVLELQSRIEDLNRQIEEKTS